MRLLDRFRRPAPAPADRRNAIRRMSGVGLALAASTLGADDAWAAIEERAARFGIVPGTVVDAQGRPVRSARSGSYTYEPYIAELTIFGGNFAIRGFAFCNGQLMGIAQNTALFSLLGTTFGGDGRVTFALPDLRGRVPVHASNGQAGPGLSPIQLGQVSGTENTTLLSTQIPQHIHTVPGTPVSSAPGTTPDPNGAYLAQSAAGIAQYVADTPTGALPGTATGIAGGSQPFSIRDPYLGLNFLIATQGIFPSRND
ncbi:MAG TPA: tail fiber protein [Rubricoccaceae bacterium]|jgi:microcystin-dependent protein